MLLTLAIIYVAYNLIKQSIETDILKNEASRQGLDSYFDASGIQRDIYTDQICSYRWNKNLQRREKYVYSRIRGDFVKKE